MRGVQRKVSSMEFATSHDRSYSRLSAERSSKARPLSCYSDLQPSALAGAESGVFAGPASSTYTTSDWNITTVKEMTLINGRVYGVSVAQQINHTTTVRSTSSQRTRCRSRVADSSVASGVSPAKSDTWYCRKTASKAAGQSATHSTKNMRAFRDITNDFAPSLKPWSPPTRKFHKTPSKDSKRVAKNEAVASTERMSDLNISQASLKPWSPPPAELYTKNVDDFLAGSKNTFTARRKSRRQSSRKQRTSGSHNKENIQPSATADNSSSHCHGDKSRISTHCSKRDISSHNSVIIRDMPRTPPRSGAVYRPRMATPEHALRSSASSIALPQSPVYQEIDLDNTYLAPSGSESGSETPTKKVDNTYDIIPDMRDTPPAICAPLPPPRRRNCSEATISKVKKSSLHCSHRLSPMKRSAPPVIRLRQQNSDTSLRTVDIDTNKLTAERTVVSTKYHKYTVGDIVKSYCKLMKNIVPEYVLPIRRKEYRAEPVHDVSLDSGHGTLSQCSPRSAFSESQLFASEDCLPGVQQPNFDECPLADNTLVEGSKLSTSEIDFHQNLREGEFYC